MYTAKAQISTLRLGRRTSPIAGQSHCHSKNVVAAPGGHAASRNDLEICLASTQDQSTLRIPKGVPVNLTYN